MCNCESFSYLDTSLKEKKKAKKLTKTLQATLEAVYKGHLGQRVASVCAVTMSLESSPGRQSKLSGPVFHRQVSEALDLILAPRDQQNKSPD